jgi:hypothetical protein
VTRRPEHERFAGLALDEQQLHGSSATRWSLWDDFSPTLRTLPILSDRRRGPC